MLNRRNFLTGTGAGLLTAVGGGLFNAASAQSGFGGSTPPARPSLVITPASFVHPLWSGRTDEVGMAMVCAIDVSSSVSSDNGEYRGQLETLAAAIASDDFRESVFMSTKSLALCLIDFDNRSKIMIPWVDFREDSPDKFLQFANMILAQDRRSSGSTDQHAALENAAQCFTNMPFKARDKSVNIMTDGTGSTSQTPPWRDLLAREYEATIYALTTNTGSSHLNKWCEDNLITPSNTFMRKDGRPLSGGFVHEVATERQTQINTNSSGIPHYKDQVLLALRRQVIMQTASLDINNPIDCAIYECRRQATYEGRKLLLPPTLEI